MTKKSVNIRINEEEFNLLKNNIPSQYDSMSDLLRSSALAVVKGQTSSREMSAFQNIVIESEKRIMSEIDKTKNILYSILEYVQLQDRKEREFMVEEYSEQLIELWKKDFEAIKQYRTIEELESSIEIPHLRDVVLDSLMILQNENKVKINDNKLRWLK